MRVALTLLLIALGMCPEDRRLALAPRLDAPRGNLLIMYYGEPLESDAFMRTCLAQEDIDYRGLGCVVSDEEIAMVEEHNRVTMANFSKSQHEAFSRCTLRAAKSACVLFQEGRASALNLNTVDVPVAVRSSAHNSMEFEVAPAHALWSVYTLCPAPHVVQSYRDGKELGLKLFSIFPGTIWTQVGLQNGDVIESVNGTTLTFASAQEFLLAPSRPARLELSVRRRGTPMKISLSLVE